MFDFDSRFLRRWWALPVVALVASTVGQPVVAAPEAEDVARDSAATSAGVDGLGKGDLDERPGRPDSVSASVSARLSGVVVEDLSRRTVSERVFAHPDGTWSTEVASGPEQVQDGEPGADGTGGWNLIDASLVKAGAGYSPKHAVTEVKFSGGATPWFAKVTEGGHKLTYSFDGPVAGSLPSPTIEGDTAVYRDVFDGVVEDVDLVMRASGTGFTHWLVFTQAPSAEELAALGAGEDDGKVVVPIRVEDNNTSSPAKVEVGAAGNITITDASGEDLISAPAPLAWDAATPGPDEFDPAGIALEARGETPQAPGDVPGEGVVVELDAEVTQATKKSTRAEQGSLVELSLDAAVLAGEGTTFPVTVDPSMTVFTGDTWVQSPTYPASQSSSPELKVGTFNGGTDKARSFLKFATDSWDGKQIESAELVLRNFYSGSCTAGAIRVNRIIDAWEPATLTWANQPSASTSNSVDVSAARGYSSACAEGDVMWDVTGIVRDWVHHGVAQRGLRLKAVDETSNNTWRRYRSGNYSGNSAQRPKINVTYNSYPYTAGTPTVVDATSTGHVRFAKPTIRVAVSDPDGGSVRADLQVLQGSTVVWSGSTGYVGSGGLAALTVTSALPDGTYTVRAKGNDGKVQSGAWGPSRTMVVDTQAPAVTFNAGAYASDSWLETKPASNTFTFSSTSSDIASFRVLKDGASSSLTPNASGVATLAWNPEKGGHTLEYQAIDKAGNLSPRQVLNFGWGTPSVDAPVAGTVPRVSGNVRVAASGGHPGTGDVTAQVQWRPAGSTAAWEMAGEPFTTPNKSGVAVASTVIDVSQLEGFDLDKRLPALLDLRVCFTYPGSPAPVCSTAEPDKGPRVMRVPHAFGEGFPTTSVEGGEVALWTGEFLTSATDAALDAGTANLSVSRTHSSFGGPHSAAAGNVFGPGWVSDLDGSDAGLEHFDLIDSTRRDGTLQLVDEDGTVLVFVHNSVFNAYELNPRTGANLAQGSWLPLDDDTAMAGLAVDVTGTGAATRITFTDDEGVITTFKAQEGAAPSSSANGVFLPESVQEPGTPGATEFLHAGGKLTKMGAPAPTGVTCPELNTTASLPTGCRVLELQYATATTATASTPGDQAGQVKAVVARIGTASGQVTKTLATYKYNTSKQLVSVTDGPTDLTTTYTYDQVPGEVWPRLASVTEPGLEKVDYGFTDLGSETGRRFTHVERQRPLTDPARLLDPKARLATIVYGLKANGTEATAQGLPNVDDALTATWAVDAMAMPEATEAIAVFGSDRKPATSGGPTAEDFKYADLRYTDARGFEVYTAEFAAGEWAYTATQYDQKTANVIRELDVNDTLAVKNGAPASTVGTLTVYNEDVIAPAPDPLPEGWRDDNVVLPAGSVVTDVYSPAREVYTPGGAVINQRVHTRTQYDQGAPNGKVNPNTQQRWALPTTTTVTLSDSNATGVTVGSAGNVDAAPDPSEEVLSQTLTGYDMPAGYTPPASLAGALSDVATGDSLWELGLATTTTQVMAGTGDDITTHTAYDKQGRVIATVQPEAVHQNSVFIPAVAGTRITTYYKGGAGNGCGTAAFQGWLCKTYFAGPAAAGDLVTSHATTYTAFGQPKTIVETGSGTAQRTATNTYDEAATLRLTSSAVATTGVANSEPLPSVSYTYSPTTGAQTKITPATGQAIETVFDTWGREISYTTSSNGGAGNTPETTTTTYDAAGRLKSHTDRSITAGGVTTYDYNTTTPGAEDYRGLPTKITVNNPGGRAVEITGTYDTAGNLTRQTMPGGVVQNTTYNSAGDLTGMSYDVGGFTNLMAWTQHHDALGRVVAEETPGTKGEASGPMREYAYDRAARLTEVTDRLSFWGTPGCTRRDYTFDRNGNRTRLDSSACDGTGTSTPKTWTYDAGDRITGTPGDGYVYDGLGRVTTLPAYDTPKAGLPGAGLTVDYYADDTARTIIQGNGDSTTMSLDAVGRRTSSVSTGTTAMTEVRHYTDASDNPGWATTTQAGAVATERYVPGLGGDLSATINHGGATDGVVQLALANPHGDVITQTTLPATGNAGWIDAWHPTDEYGNQLNAFYTAAGTTATNTASASPNTGLGYGWLGAEERAMHNSGLIYMGARLYNPVTGAFTSTDPIHGGNTTAYAYPQDPINQFDLSGECNRCSDAWNWGKKQAKRGYKYAKKHKKSLAVKGVTFVAAGACGASLICAVGVGTVGGVGSYALKQREDGKKISKRGLVTSGLSGAAQEGATKFARNLIIRKGKKHVGKLKPHPRPKVGGAHRGKRTLRNLLR